MEGEVFDDLRQFIEGAKKITEWREISFGGIGCAERTLREAIRTSSNLLFSCGSPKASATRRYEAYGRPNTRNPRG